MGSSIRNTVGGALAALAIAQAAPPAAAQEVLATAEVNQSGIKAEVTECRIGDGSLGIKIRLTNSGNGNATVNIVRHPGKYDDQYVMASKKKYLVLRDAHKKPIAATEIHPRIKKGESWTWWAKFQAPPAGVDAVDYHWPLGPPIEKIPCKRA